MQPPTELILIDPQPSWEEDPSQGPDGAWVGRYRYSTGYGDYDVATDVIDPPNLIVEPIEIDRKWYWRTKLNANPH